MEDEGKEGRMEGRGGFSKRGRLGERHGVKRMGDVFKKEEVDEIGCR